MLLWRIINFVILYMVLGINGNPLAEKTSERNAEAQRALISKLLIRRIKNNYLCRYYANPAYEQYFSSSPLTSTDYLINLRSLRARCLEQPSQKYSVWDLVR